MLPCCIIEKVECRYFVIHMQIHVRVCVKMVHMPDRYYDDSVENKAKFSQMENTKSGNFYHLNAVIKYSCHAFHNTDRIMIQCFQTSMISHMCFTEHAEPDTIASSH